MAAGNKSHILNNLLSGYLSRFYRLVISLLVVPIYLEYLGAEAYGVVAFHAVVLLMFELLDFGMRASLTREVARSLVGTVYRKSIEDLIGSFETVTLSVGIALVVVVFCLSGLIAEHWLTTDSIPDPVISNSLVLMMAVTVVMALQLLHVGALSGAGRLTKVNLYQSLTLTVQCCGATFFLMYMGWGLEGFFGWMLFVQTCGTALFRSATQKVLCIRLMYFRFRWEAIESVREFSVGSMVLAILGGLYSQADKVVFSLVLPLSVFGYYMIAQKLASVLQMIVDPVWRSFYPLLISAYAERDSRRFARHFHNAAHLAFIPLVSILGVVWMHSQQIVSIWLGDTAGVALIGSIAVATSTGHFLNALLRVPHACQLAAGWTSLGIWLSIGSLLVYVPTLYWIAESLGISVAVWLWGVLNLCLVVATLVYMFKKILLGERLRWVVYDIGFPLCLAISVVLVLQELYAQWVGAGVISIFVSFLALLVSQSLLYLYIKKEMVAVMVAQVVTRISR